MTTSVAPADLKIKIGNERLIKVTENASRRLRSLLERQGRPAGALRVAVIGGGCSGLQYKMDLVDGPAPRDILVHSANVRDRKSTRLNSSHVSISYAVFCLKKKTKRVM